MIIMLTPSMVIEDIVTAAKYKMSKLLSIPYERVSAEVDQADNGKIRVAFSVNGEGIDNFVSEETCRAVINSVWVNDYKVKLIWSLENVKQKRMKH